jgi:tetratricopeptide (TPR) repeat protein
MSDQEKELLEEEESQNKGGIATFLDNNGKLFLIAGIALLLISGGLYYYFSYRLPAKEKEAAEAMFMADRYFEKDSFDLALNGDGEYLGALDIVEEYPNTKAGKRASYYIARALVSKKEFEEAIPYLKSVDFDDVLVSPQAQTLMGDCYSELEQYEDAASAYMKAAKMSKNEFSTPYALSKAARVYEKLGQWEKALDVYEQIKADYQKTPFGKDIDKHISKVETAASN